MEKSKREDKPERWYEIFDSWGFLIMLSLTLGLAPFYPEPHIVGKIRWIAGGAVGMQALDWLDAIYHGIPFILIFRKLLNDFILKRKTF